MEFLVPTFLKFCDITSSAFPASQPIADPKVPLSRAMVCFGSSNGFSGVFISDSRKSVRDLWAVSGYRLVVGDRLGGRQRSTESQ